MSPLPQTWPESPHVQVVSTNQMGSLVFCSWENISLLPTQYTEMEFNTSLLLKDRSGVGVKQDLIGIAEG